MPHTNTNMELVVRRPTEKTVETCLCYVACVVVDPTEKGDQPHGKQYMAAFAASKASSKYTSTSGIWATVWLEYVPATYLADLHIVTDNIGANAATM